MGTVGTNEDVDVNLEEGHSAVLGLDNKACGADKIMNI